jgi:TRAP-type C4-dicarboxylate transport system substrate-binding protein
MNVMREFDKELREKTGDEVGFKIYAGGVLGDEKDVLRKMRIGQVHAAGFTGVPMGEILPEVRILDTPFLFRNSEEVDFVYTKFSDRFSQGFEKKGYILLGWAEVGFVYVFTKSRVEGLEEMKKVKMWIWEGDPVAEATFKAFGLRPVPLSPIDVMTALQTNMVEGMYTSPLAAVVLQWFTKVKYMTELPLANAAGAILVSTKKFKRIPEEQQSILKELAKKHLANLTRLSRKDNEVSIETLKQNGVQIVPVADAQTLQSYYEVGEKARRALVGRYYSAELLGQVESALDRFRDSSTGTR